MPRLSRRRLVQADDSPAGLELRLGNLGRRTFQPTLRPADLRVGRGVRMHWLGWIVVLFAFIEGGWLAYDGGHALVTGEYVTPSSGEYAGQLGPWSKLVSAVGIDPRSTLMKSIHLILGLVWVAMIVPFIFRVPWAWRGMFICAVAGLWYLPFGTLLSVIQIVLLLLRPVRASASIPR